MPELAANGNVQIIDKNVDRIVEVIRLVPVQKVVERLVERLQVIEKPSVRDVPQIQTRVIVENVDKPVNIEREVYTEMVQEVVIDKVVERIVEKIREVPVDKIVERRVEVIEEVPVVRYVDRVITKEVPVIQVVDRVVEILKEKPVETIKEVPVYVKVEVGEAETRTRGTMATHSSVQQVVYERQAAPVQQTTYYIDEQQQRPGSYSTTTQYVDRGSTSYAYPANGATTSYAAGPTYVDQQQPVSVLSYPATQTTRDLC